MSYEKQKRYQRRKASEVADIGTIPAVRNPARRAACERDTELFLQTYFPASTGMKPFSPDHRAAIGRIQSCEMDGGLFAQAFPRGSGKTTVSENSSIHALVYGHRSFITLFGADANAAGGNVESIKMELAENELLMEDFPEVCHPIRALEGKPQRCASQTHVPGNVEGWEPDHDDPVAAGGPRQTHIAWTADTIVLPTVYVPEGWGTVEGPKPGAKLVPSRASGAIIATRGLMGGSRGLKHKRPDGTQQRPDLIIIDDPQTDESASTALQVNKRLNVIRKSVLKLGGHGRKLAVVMNATVIRKGDLVEQIFDPKKFPAWQCVRIKMVKRWADAHEALWLGDYARLRNTYDPDALGDQQRAHREATEFYRRNRDRMDAGCEVFWEHCFDPATELSAVQHAYNMLIDDGPEVFASECQNEPLEQRADGEDEDAPTADGILSKVNGLERGVVPQEATHLVAFIDVQKPLLPWMVLAVGAGFGGAVVDYGTFPDQGRSRWTVRDARVTMAKKLKVSGDLEAVIYAGLDACVGLLMAREWKRPDGVVMRPELVVIDANWGESTDVVYQFCRQSPHAAVLMPSHGRYVGATSRPFNEYKANPGDRLGLNWRIPTVQNRRSTRYLLFDANYWKSFAASRLRTAAGGKGSFGVFGRDPQEHGLLADHLTAEKPVRVEAKGRTVVEWKLPPSRPDNHWWDCLVGCCVAASVRGANLEQFSAAVAKRKKVKLSELRKSKQQKA